MADFRRNQPIILENLLVIDSNGDDVIVVAHAKEVHNPLDNDAHHSKTSQNSDKSHKNWHHQADNETDGNHGNNCRKNLECQFIGLPPKQINLKTLFFLIHDKVS